MCHEAVCYRHAALGRCGESYTLTVTSSLSNYTMYSVCKQTAYRARVDVRISTCTCTYHVVFFGSTIVDGPEVPEDRDPAQREAEGPRSSMDYSEFPLLDFSHQKNPGAPASPYRVTAVPCDVQRKGQRSRWRYMEQWEKFVAKDRRSQHGDCPRAAKTTTRQATLSQQFRT